MHRAAGAIARQLRQIEGFRHQTLAGEGGVAVEEQRDDLGPVLGVVAPALLGPGAALDDRVDGLEVARVGGQADVHLPSRARRVVGRVAPVVLDIAIGVVGGLEVVLELVEDEIEGFAEDVDQDVEAAAVGHPHDDLFGAGFRGGVHELVERRDHRLDALEGEAFLALVAGVEKGLEDLGVA